LKWTNFNKKIEHYRKFDNNNMLENIKYLWVLYLIFLYNNLKINILPFNKIKKNKNF